MRFCYTMDRKHKPFFVQFFWEIEGLFFQEKTLKNHAPMPNKA